MDLRQLERDVMRLVVAGDDDAAIALMEENLPLAEASDDLEPLPFLYEELANCYSRQDRHQEAVTAMDKRSKPATGDLRTDGRSRRRSCSRRGAQTKRTDCSTK
jgi:hypothetical protein